MKNTQKITSTHTSTVQFRRSALAAACALAVGSLAMPGAHAQTATYNLTYTGPAQTFTNVGYTDKYIKNDQVKSGVVNAIVGNVFTGATFVSASGSSPATVSNNSSTALAIGNLINPNSIDIVSLTPANGSAGILSGQVRSAGATTAKQSSIKFGVVETAQAPAPVTVSGNTLAASTTLNQARSIVAGNVPTGYNSTVQGSVANGYTTGAFTTATAGSVGISSQQTALNASAKNGSLASIDDSKVTLDLQNTSGGVASSPLVLTNNTLSTKFGANAASNIFNATSAGSPNFQGSVAVSNAQLNAELSGTVTGPTSAITGSGITADITKRVGGSTSLSAPLDVSGNTIAAASTGNAAGNAIVFDSGLSVTGNSSPVSNTLANGSTTVAANQGADMVLTSGQGNQGTRLQSTITTGVVSVKADALVTGGSITASGNTVGTSATGNLANSLISADSSSFTATAAAANLQRNDLTSIGATNSSGAITVGVGKTGAVVAGPITASNNTIGATAEGSVATTEIALKSANLNALTPSGTSQVSANITGFGAVSALAGASANNLQGNYGNGPTAASVTGGSIAVTVANQITLTAPSVTLDGNTINADATGNSAATKVGLSGANVTAQAAVGNTQVNRNSITGTISNSGVTLTSGRVTGSALTVSNSTVAASALANDAVNTVAGTNVANLTTGNSAFGSGNTVSSNAGVNTQSNANFGIASGQHNAGSVQASNVSTGSSAAIRVAPPTETLFSFGGVSINSGTLTVNDNSVTADTTGNRVANTLSLAAGNLETGGNAATQIGGISSLQSNNVTGVANATVGGPSAATMRAGIAYQRGLLDSELTVSGNTVASASVGNQSANLVNVVADSLVSNAPGTGTGSTSSGSTSTVKNEFGLLNRQVDNVTDGRTATTQNTTVGVSGTGALITVNGSNLTVSGNSITAEARNNTSSNAINLTGFSSLDSGAGLLNDTSSSTNVAAIVSEGSVRIHADSTAFTTVGGSSLALTGNKVQSLAVGSSAGNTLNVQASNLSGNANLSTSNAVAASGSASALADYNLVNLQAQTGNVTASTSTPVRIMLSDSFVTGGDLTLSTNTVQAVAQATSASNTLKLAGSNLSDITGALASSQNTTGSVTATLAPEAGGVGVVHIEAISTNGTPVTLTGNQLLASAGQNEAFNTQRVTGTGIAGKALGGSSTDFSIANAQQSNGAVSATAEPKLIGVQASLVVNNGSVVVSNNSATSNANANNSANALSLAPDSTLAATGLVSNNQEMTAAVSATLGSGTAASVGLNTLRTNNTAVTVSGNSLASQASGNTALNELAASGASIAGGSGAPSFETSNVQATSSDVTASANAGVIGATVFTSNGTPFSVTGNTVMSVADANKAQNSQASTATGSLTGSGGVMNRQTSSSGGVSATVAADTVGIAGGLALNASSVAITGNTLTAKAGRNTADNSLVASSSTVSGDTSVTPAAFNVNSLQTAGGAVTASNTTQRVGVAVPAADNSPLSITANRVAAEANSNTSNSSLSLAAVNALNTNGRVNNQQTANGGAVSATVSTTAVGVVSGFNLTDSPVVVSGNTLEAKASRNVTSNALQASAPTLNGLGTAPGFVVTSSQDGTGNVTALNTLGLVGVLENAATGSSMTVNGNTAASSANVNIASNTLALNAIGALTGTAQVSNTQNANLGSAVTATTGGASIGSRATVGVGSPVVAGNALNSSPVTVSGNVLSAQGGGNTALNALEALAVGSIGGSVSPTFAVLNTQNNYASVDTTVHFANIGATAATFTGSSATVQSNNVVASGYGNSASNSIGLSALSANQNLASASLINAQTSTASINSTVAGISIGVIGGGASGGASTVTGNAILAQSIGNSASNIIAAR